jgi:hypothetical protein
VRLTVIAGVLVAVAIVIGFAVYEGRVAAPVTATQPALASPTPAADAPEFSTTRPEGQAAPDFREAGMPPIAALTPRPMSGGEERSPIADLLNAPDTTAQQDAEVVLRLFDFYLERFGALPAAETNAQFVNALTGNNPRRVALIERSHPAINREGELTDRWGTPFFFHLVAHDQIEIRSAGPDKEMWSGDDVLTASASLSRARSPAP